MSTAFLFLSHKPSWRFNGSTSVRLIHFWSNCAIAFFLFLSSLSLFYERNPFFCLCPFVFQSHHHLQPDGCRTHLQPAFFLSVGYFLGLLGSSSLFCFIFTVITALISFHPLPSLPLHPKLNYHLRIRRNLSTSSIGNCFSNKLRLYYLNKSIAAKSKVLQQH